MKTRVTILFVFRRKFAPVQSTAILAEEVGRVVCRVTAHNKRAFISTNLSTSYGEWDAAAQRVRGNKGQAVTINAAITKMRDQLIDIWADLERQKRPVTAQAITRSYRSDGAVLNMQALYEAFMQERATLIGIEISSATHQVAQTRQRILTAFLHAHNLTDLRPEEFNHNLADKLLYWCLRERGYQRNFTNKVLQSMSQVLRWGVRREHLLRNPMEFYQLKAAPTKEIKYLSVGELRVITTQGELPHYLDRVRDCFVFQCWTGLAYADLAALNVQRDAEYHRDGQGNIRRVLRITRQKSTMQKGYECVIPLLPEAERLLSKWDDMLPVISAVKYNAYLKEIGKRCAIDVDKMTSHVGRKTAGVMMLNLGIRMETVSKFLGHSSVKMTEKIYAKILDTTVVDDFSKLFGVATTPAPALEIGGEKGIRPAYGQASGRLVAATRPARRLAA